MTPSANDTLTMTFEDLSNSAGNTTLMNELINTTASPTLSRIQLSDKMNVSESCNQKYDWISNQDNHECCKCVKDLIVPAQDTKGDKIKTGNNFHFCGLDDGKKCTSKTEIDSWVRAVTSGNPNTPKKFHERLRINLDIWKPAGLQIHLEDVRFSDVTVTRYFEPKLKYERGTLVWVRMMGYPTWPAMVDKDPDNDTYYRIMEQSPQKVQYHVVFFDETPYISRAWRPEECLKLFTFSPRVRFRSMSHFKRFHAGFSEAKKAVNMSLKERIEKYSFVNKMKQPDVILVEH